MRSSYSQEDASYVPMEPPPVKSIRLPIRGVRPDILAKYKVVGESASGNILFPYTDRRNKQLKAYHCRKPPFTPNPNKVMPWLGSPKNTALFGSGAVSSKAVILCFGEFDAMSAHQMTGYRGLSPLNDDAAAGHINLNLDEFENADVIYVIPDNDKSGRETLEQVLEVLPLEKVKIVTLPGDVKDVNDMLMQGREEEFKKVLWAGTSPQSSFIVYQDDLTARTLKLMDTPECFIGYETGWQDYDELVGGVRLGEIVVIGGKTSSGKSSFARALSYRLRDYGCLYCGYEVRAEMDNLAFASLHTKQNLKYQARSGQMDKVAHYLKIWNEESNLCYVNPKFTDLKTYARQIKQAVKMQGFKVITLDHLHYMENAMSAKDSHAKQTQSIETFMLTMHELIVEINVALVIVSHVARNKDSKGVERVEVNIEDFHGSSAIEKYCDVGLAIFGERYNKSVTLRVGKNRLFGAAGDIQLEYQEWGDYR